MTTESPSAHLFSVLTLKRTRGLVRGKRGFSVAACVAIVYAFLAMLAGYMLVFGDTHSPTTIVTWLIDPYSPEWWNYPALLVLAPGGMLVLPFFETLTMIIVSIGVGLGMGAGLILAVRVARQWKRARARGGVAGTMAGLTPAMVAMLTLGACCSTSAAAAAGIGAVAMASGVSIAMLSLNTWYLNVFQIVVLAIALIAQEQLLSLYGSLLGIPKGGAEPTEERRTVRVRAAIPVLALRFFAVAAGTFWGLAFLLELATPAPAGTPFAGLLLGGLLQHVGLGVAVISAGLFPSLLLGVLSQRSWRGAVPVFRGLLIVCGASLALGVPPPLSGWGVYGLGNEVLGAAGVGPALGGVLPPGSGGTPVVLAWAVLYALLGIFAVVLGLRPGRALRYLEGRRAAAADEASPRGACAASPDVAKAPEGPSPALGSDL